MNKKNILILLVLLCFILSVGTVSAHADPKENPRITFIDQQEIQNSTDGVSEDVNFRMSIVQIHEVRNVTVTAQHMESREYYLNKTDNNPSDGWSILWDTSNSPNGEYWIEAHTKDVETNEGTAGFKLILNNIPKESQIIMDNLTTFVNKSTNIYAYISNKNSTPLQDKNVEFIIDGETYSTKTTSNGYATISFTPKEVKEYEILVKFNGDNRALPTQTIANLKTFLNINTTVVSINDTTGNKGEEIILKANLLAPGIYTNVNKTIDFYIDNTFVGSNITDENGDAILHYKIKENGGHHVYSVSYKNEEGDVFGNIPASLYIPESEIYVSMNALTYSKDGIFTKGNNVELTFVINNNGPDNAKNVVLRYQVPDSLKYINSSISEGEITFNDNELLWMLNDLSVGSQNMTVMFNVLEVSKINLTSTVSTDTYVDSTNNITQTKFLTVTGYKLGTKSLVKYFTASNKYRVYLYTDDGNVVEGANIKITIGKQSLTLKTNSYGYVEVAVNFQPGKYNVKISCNNLYASNYITIKPLIITKNITVKKARVIKFSAKILNNKGKVVKNKKVTFKVKGKTYNVKTNSKGYATLSLKNLKISKYVVYTSYGKSTAKNIIKVKR